MLISVLIPCLNSAQFLRSAVESVLGEGRGDVECVVVDGLSTDGSLDLLKELKDRYGSCLTYLHEPDSGPSDAYNKAVRISSGDVLICIGADDTIAEGALSFVSDRFREDPDLKILYGECEVTDGVGAYLGRYAVKDFSLSIQINEGCCVQFPSCYYRREVLDCIGLMDTGDKYADLDWIARAAARYRFQRVDRVLSNFRFHSGGLTGSTWNSELPSALYRLNRKYGGSLWSPVVRRYFLLRMERVWPISLWIARRLGALDWANAPVAGDFYIFGAALTGYSCLSSLRESGRRVLGFIDNFPPLDGTYCDLPVCRPSELIGSRTVAGATIVIATGGYPFSMERQLEALGWQGQVYYYSGSR